MNLENLNIECRKVADRTLAATPIIDIVRVCSIDLSVILIRNHLRVAKCVTSLLSVTMFNLGLS